LIKIKPIPTTITLRYCIDKLTIIFPSLFVFLNKKIMLLLQLFLTASNHSRAWMKGTPFISNKILDSTSVALAISNHHHNQISEKKEKDKNKKETQIRKRDKAKMPTRPEQPVISKAPPV